jgi:hypothetical protein
MTIDKKAKKPSEIINLFLQPPENPKFSILGLLLLLLPLNLFWVAFVFNSVKFCLLGLGMMLFFWRMNTFSYPIFIKHFEIQILKNFIEGKMPLPFSQNLLLKLAKMALEITKWSFKDFYPDLAKFKKDLQEFKVKYFETGLDEYFFLAAFQDNDTRIKILSGEINNNSQVDFLTNTASKLNEKLIYSLKEKS